MTNRDRDRVAEPLIRRDDQRHTVKTVNAIMQTYYKDWK